MTSSYWTRTALLLGASLLTGCPDGGTETTTGVGTTTDGPTTSTTPTTTVPTTSDATTTDVGTTTGEPTTTGATSTGDDTTGVTTTNTSGGDAIACTDLDAEELCAAEADTCKWSGVVGFTYGAQGCQGAISNFCIDRKPAGAASAWYREVKGDAEVVEFAYTPTDLDESWKPCDCDGPLACLCTSVTADCPERQDEFCGINITELGCENATFKGNAVCGWFGVDAQGANDDMCTVDLIKQRCLPAVDTDKTGCKDEQGPLPPPCQGDKKNPVYWHEQDGVLEITETCGPKPLGWTHCEAVDTPEQPGECTCNCL